MVLRYLQTWGLVILLVMINVFTIHYRILPESARWLVVQDRLDEAHRVLMKYSKRNSTRVTAEFLRSALASCRQGIADAQTTKLKHSPLDLLRTSRMRTRTLVLWFNW